MIRVKEEVTQHPPYDPHGVSEEAAPERKGRRGGWFVLTAVFAAALAAGVWYGYPALQANQSTLAQVPVLRSSFEAMSQRVNSAEAQVRAWAGDREALEERLAKLQSALESGARQARILAQQAGEASFRRMQEEVDRLAARLQTRMARLEAGQEAEAARVARLQDELNRVRQEVAMQAQQLTVARQEDSRDRAGLEQQVAGLGRQFATGQREVENLSSRIPRGRVDFEVTRNHSQELAPGISLGVTGTDVRYRRVNGWMWLMPDRRTVWLRNQSAQEPVVFYGLADGKRRELVITHVTGNSVVGYLLLPSEGRS